MFKKYRFEWMDANNKACSIEFFVRSRSRKGGGFFHEACMLGMPPRLDGLGTSYAIYSANEERLMKSRYQRSSYSNRTWECWRGHDCLKLLWDKLAGLKFLDMSEVWKTNPFDSDDEPAHEDLWEPDELFGRFTGR